jgi:hypothetical protein
VSFAVTLKLCATPAVVGDGNESTTSVVAGPPLMTMA